MESYFKSLRNFANFADRSSRKELILFSLINIAIGVILELIDGKVLKFNANGKGLLSILFEAIIFIPGISIFVRRLHDINLSGWWLVIGPTLAIAMIFITHDDYYTILIIFIMIVYVMAKRGDNGWNRFGIDPLTNN